MLSYENMLYTVVRFGNIMRDIATNSLLFSRNVVSSLVPAKWNRSSESGYVVDDGRSDAH